MPIFYIVMDQWSVKLAIHQVARGFTRGAFELKPLTSEKDYKTHQNAISMLRPTEGGTYTPKGKVTIFPIKKWKTRGKWSCSVHCTGCVIYSFDTRWHGPMHDLRLYYFFLLHIPLEIVNFVWSISAPWYFICFSSTW